jgi:hypothetical protein
MTTAQHVQRDPRELRAQSLHVFWHLRQALRLATHVERCRRDGRDVLHDALDAAALEAFTVSARALIEFLWKERPTRKDGRPLYPNDARAVDWFAGTPLEWEPGEEPRDLERVSERVGWGVAHVSYRRIDPAEEWGWHHLAISHHLASRFYDFAASAPADRVPDDFEREVCDEILEYRSATASREPFEFLHNPPGPVGTPGFAITAAQIRRPPSPSSD